MIPAPPTPDEPLRIQALEEYEILDSLPEQDFDDITRIAAEICGYPISLVSLIDQDRQWFKSRHGLEAQETPRAYAFCAHAIHNPNEIFQVPDSTLDERFSDNPLVTDAPNVISYCGVPLVTPDGRAVGTLCVINNEPGELPPGKQAILRALANQVMGQMELRKKIRNLEQTQTELQQAYTELDRYAYAVTHDLKGPLRGIESLSQFLLEDYADSLDEEGRNYLHLIGDRVTRLQNLITGVLQTAKMQAINVEDKEEFDLVDLAQSIVTLLGPESSVKVTFPEGPLKITGYRFGIHVILQNLISNAIKYNPGENPEVKISFMETPGMYHIAVSDNGPGIDPQFHEKVFTKFQTLNATDRYQQKGTGIGLALVKDLCNKMKGRIELDSDVGKGSTFHVYLGK